MQDYAVSTPLYQRTNWRRRRSARFRYPTEPLRLLPTGPDRVHNLSPPGRPTAAATCHLKLWARGSKCITHLPLQLRICACTDEADKIDRLSRILQNMLGRRFLRSRACHPTQGVPGFLQILPSPTHPDGSYRRKLRLVSIRVQFESTHLRPHGRG